jgi:hypothetical protein
MPFEARHLLLAFAVSSLGTLTANAYPKSMDIGILAIDYYSGNTGGGGMADLYYMHDGGVNFYWGAATWLPPSAGSATRAPSIAMDLSETQVKMRAVTNIGTTRGEREYNDFLYFGGHGLDSTLFLGDDKSAGFGRAFPSQLHLGKGYTRWFLANACALFHYPNPAAVWNPAFQGLKAMLGFVSLVYDNPWSWYLYDDFWQNWTGRGKNLMMSFFGAEDDLVNAYLLPTRGLSEGCLSAVNQDYCSDVLQGVPSNYSQASFGAGTFYAHSWGPIEY